MRKNRVEKWRILSRSWSIERSEEEEEIEERVFCALYFVQIYTRVYKRIYLPTYHTCIERVYIKTHCSLVLYIFFFCYKQSTHRTRNECGPKSRAILAVRWVFKIGCMEWVKRKRAMVFICVLYNGNIFMYIYSVFRIYV